MKHYAAVLLSLLVMSISLVYLVPPARVAATALTDFPTVAADAKSDACTGIGLAGADCNGTTGSDKLNTTLKTGLNIFSVIIGIVAVVMIVVAGFRFITSGGDSGKVAGAKNAILYAIIGLVVVVFAQSIVFFVLKNV